MFYPPYALRATSWRPLAESSDVLSVSGTEPSNSRLQVAMKRNGIQLQELIARTKDQLAGDLAHLHKLRSGLERTSIAMERAATAYLESRTLLESTPPEESAIGIPPGRHQTGAEPACGYRG